ncbi:MAG: hypothetical protein V7607_2841 [Solirubrobacteraceae bacterium]
MPGARWGVASAAPGSRCGVASAAPGSRSPRCAGGRDWAMREGSGRPVVPFRWRLAAERACFATPSRAVGRTPPDRSRFPGGNRRSSRTALDHPRFPGVNLRSSRDPARERRPEPPGFPPSLPNRDRRRSAETGARRRGREDARRRRCAEATDERPASRHHTRCSPRRRSSTASPSCRAIDVTSTASKGFVWSRRPDRRVRALACAHREDRRARAIDVGRRRRPI